MKEQKKKLVMLMFMDLVDSGLLTSEEAILASKIYFKNEDESLVEGQIDNGEAA